MSVMSVLMWCRKNLNSPVTCPFLLLAKMARVPCNGPAFDSEGIYDTMCVYNTEFEGGKNLKKLVVGTVKSSNTSQTGNRNDGILGMGRTRFQNETPWR